MRPPQHGWLQVPRQRRRRVSVPMTKEGAAQDNPRKARPLIQSINPATGAVIATYEAHTPDQVDEALTAAVTAQAQWRKRPVEERVTLLTSIAKKAWRGSSPRRWASL